VQLPNAHPKRQGLFRSPCLFAFQIFPKRIAIYFLGGIIFLKKSSNPFGLDFFATEGDEVVSLMQSLRGLEK